MRRCLAMLSPVLLLLACHAREVRHPQAAQATAGDSEAVVSSKKKGALPSSSRRVTSDRPVATTPAAFFDAERIRSIQTALSSHGQPVEATGQLDGKTQEAIARFQKDNAQPSTGFPDFDTLKRLGLDPQKIYLGNTPPQQ